MARFRTMSERLAQAAQPKVVPGTIPVSITGINTRDAVTAMSETDAVNLINWYPDAGGVTLRNGSAQFCTGLGTGGVNTLDEYIAEGKNHFLAACDATIWDITTGAGVSLATGFTSSKWQTANFQSHMFWANGVDTPQVYDGGALADTGFTGPTMTEVIGWNVYKNRLFAWTVNSNSFWYADLEAISGTLHEFPLSMISELGGDIVTMTTMSHDGGDGVQDMAVFILSSGEVVIYQGTDPGDADFWELVGRYRISPPVNIRAVARYGAESYLTTFDDHVPLQQQLVALKLGQVPPRSKISGAVQAAVAANQTGFGWQAIFYPKGRRLMFNVPNPNGTYSQHAYNTSTDAWTIFTGMNSLCFGLYKSNLYFGSTSGIVYQADFGTTDDGAAIAFDGQCAWNTFDDPRRKRLSAIRPIFQTLGIANILYGTGFDYEEVPTTTTTTTLPTSGSPWDTSYWDVSYWSPETATDARWRMAGGTGVAVGYRVAGNSLTSLAWLRTDVRLEIGKDL